MAEAYLATHDRESAQYVHMSMLQQAATKAYALSTERGSDCRLGCFNLEVEPSERVFVFHALQVLGLAILTLPL